MKLIIIRSSETFADHIYDRLNLRSRSHLLWVSWELGMGEGVTM